MDFYSLHCEVPGGVGAETIYDKTQIPWEIVSLHVVFDGWLGGEILVVSSAIIISPELEKEISFNFTGIESYEGINLEKSDTFNTVHPNLQLPNFRRVLIGKNAFKDDFALVKHGDYYNQLIISEKAKNLLDTYNLGNYSIELAVPI